MKIKVPLTSKIFIIYSESWCFYNNSKPNILENNVYFMSYIDLKFQTGNPKYMI